MLDPDTPAPARLLKGGAVTFAVLGTAFVVWVLDKWRQMPEARASQFGFEAPLWPALAVFVIVSTLAAVGMLWRAARRVESGEDLFAQRHRRRPEPPEDPPPSA
ncbi:MAG: ABC transporter permease [Salinibacter sp.]